MSLLDKAQEIMGAFDPETDTVDTFENLPDGTYHALLEKVEFRSNDKGTQWISFEFSVLEEGDNLGRLMWDNRWFTEKSEDRSIKSVIKTAHDFGYELPAEAFVDLDTLAEYLNSMAGEQAMVTQKTNKSGFTNYTLEPVE